jgi:hypothetical protein
VALHGRRLRVFMAFFLAGFLGTWRDAEFSDLAG